MVFSGVRCLLVECDFFFYRGGKLVLIIKEQVGVFEISAYAGVMAEKNKRPALVERECIDTKCIHSLKSRFDVVEINVDSCRCNSEYHSFKSSALFKLLRVLGTIQLNPSHSKDK